MKDRLMHWLLSALILSSMTLCSCATHRPQPVLAPTSEPIGIIQPPADKEFVRINSPSPAENGPSRQLDSVVVAPRRTVLDKLLGRKPASKVASSLPVTVGKKSAVSVYYGPATVSTTTVGKKSTAATAEGATAIAPAKKAGPVVVADSGAVVQLATSKKGPAAAAGHDATATAKEGGLPWWLWVVIVGGGGFLVYRGYKRFLSV